MYKRQAQAFIPLWAPWLTIVTGPKGSYREDDVLNLIEDVLDDMSETRQWRIMLLDAYSAHLSDRIRVCAWHKGYIVITHGGGASAVTQPNDTDLHGPLKRDYTDLEQQDTLEQLRARPSSCPVTKRQDVVAWVSTIWYHSELHLKAADGFLKTGLCNALDGTEDTLICREAGQFWSAGNMPERRREAVHNVDVECDARRLRWTYEDVYSLVAPFPPRGRRYDAQPQDEGSDVDHRGDDGSSSDGDQNDGNDDDDDHGETAHASTVHPHPPSSSAVAEQPSSSVASVLTRQPLQHDLAIHDVTARIDSISTVLQQVRDLKHSSLEAQVSHALHAEERKLRHISRTDPVASSVYMSERQEQERSELRKRQAIQKAFDEDHKRRRSIRDLVQQQRKLEDSRRALEQASTLVECQRALKSFDVEDLGCLLYTSPSPRD